MSEEEEEEEEGEGEGEEGEEGGRVTTLTGKKVGVSTSFQILFRKVVA